MGRLTCSICKTKKPLIGLSTWYRCSKHGVVCNKCAVNLPILKIIKGTSKCPKCSNTLKDI